MKITVITAVVAGMLSSGAFAQEIAPTAVTFTDGAVEQSLTGVAGDPANGRVILGDNGQGNCVACHMISEMADVPFQGNVGPMLDGTGARWSEGELRGIVVNAKMLFEGTMMPSFYRTEGFTRPGNVYTGKAADETFGPLLSAQDVEDVVAYLVTLKE